MHPKYVVPFGYSATSSPTRGHSPMSSHHHHYSHSAAPSPSSYHPHSHHHSASAVYFPHTPQHQVHIDQFGFAAFATSNPHSLQQHSSQHTAHYQQHYQAAVAQPAELVCDHYMEFHRRSQGFSSTTSISNSTAPVFSDNEFDFVLLPSARNARKGMKTIVPNDTIPCKYGRSCFRKDCRFSHSQDELSESLSLAPTSPAGPSSTSSSPLTVSSDSASDADSNSPTLNALRASRTPSPVRRTAAFHAHTDFISVQH